MKAEKPMDPEFRGVLETGYDVINCCCASSKEIGTPSIVVLHGEEDSIFANVDLCK
jgi:hypothetical protein